MTSEDIRNYCLSLKGVTECFPFDDDALVFKVMGKMFSLNSLLEHTLALKCDPEKAVALREQYSAVLPGYHFNKRHWNTVLLDSNLPDKLIREWITDSYDLVVEGLSRKLREELKA